MLSRTQILMATYATVTLPQDAKNQSQKVFEIIKSVESALSSFDSKSALYHLNHKHLLQNRTPYLREALQLCKDIYRETDGYFNPNVGTLTKKFYHFGERKEFIATKALMMQHRPKPFFIETDHYYLKSALDQTIDLGGMGKGFAIDQVRNFLDTQSIKPYRIALSGDIYCKGECRIGIQSPWNPEKVLGMIAVDSAAISTSGSYERKIYGTSIDHLIDTKTFASKSLVSVTLVSQSIDNARLDAYATALSVMTHSARKHFLALHRELAYLLIDKIGRCYSNPAFHKLLISQSLSKECPHHMKIADKKYKGRKKHQKELECKRAKRR